MLFLTVFDDYWYHCGSGEIRQKGMGHAMAKPEKILELAAKGMAFGGALGAQVGVAAEAIGVVVPVPQVKVAAGVTALSSAAIGTAIGAVVGGVAGLAAGIWGD